MSHLFLALVSLSISRERLGGGSLLQWVLGRGKRWQQSLAAVISSGYAGEIIIIMAVVTSNGHLGERKRRGDSRNSQWIGTQKRREAVAVTCNGHSATGRGAGQGHRQDFERGVSIIAV